MLKREEWGRDRLTSGESRIGSKAGVAGISRDGEEVRWLGRDNSIRIYRWLLILNTSGRNQQTTQVDFAPFDRVNLLREIRFAHMDLYQ